MLHLQNRTVVFLDRDGVINRKPPEGEYVERWEDFHLLPGVEQAIAALNCAGRKVIVVTNQRGIALNRYSHADLQNIHQNLQAHLAACGAHIDAFYYCPHDRSGCDCRKPQAGLFLQAFRDFPDACVESSVMIGDSPSDMEAGHRLGMPAIFIEGPLETRPPGADKAKSAADLVCASLAQAVEILLQANRSMREGSNL